MSYIDYGAALTCNLKTSLILDARINNAKLHQLDATALAITGTKKINAIKPDIIFSKNGLKYAAVKNRYGGIPW